MTRIYSLNISPCMMFCSLEFALRNVLSFKLMFCVQIHFVFCVTLKYKKENSEFNLCFWSHPRITTYPGLFTRQDFGIFMDAIMTNRLTTDCMSGKGKKGDKIISIAPSFRKSFPWMSSNMNNG